MVENAAAPWPVIQIAIEPKNPADRERLDDAISALAAADPFLRASTDAESGQVILGGTSELHLDRTVDLLIRNQGIAIHIGAPQVAFRETVIRPIEVDFTHKTLADGARQFARVKLRVEPERIDGGFTLMSILSDGGLPAECLTGVRKGVGSAMKAGIVAGFPVVGVKVAVLDCAFHETDSSALAFEIAGRRAMRDALLKGGAALLEPIMAVEAVVPQAHVDAAVADLKSRRGEIQDRRPAGESVVLGALTPLANLFGYVNSLRSFTKGRGTFTMDFAHYAVVPTPGDLDPPAAPAVALRP